MLNFKMKSRKILRKVFLIPLIFFCLNLVFQNWNLSRLIRPQSDEGVYLYSAKLISQGFLPYKDYFLAHPPFLILVVRFILWLAHYNLHLFHFIYTILVFSALFPIYWLTLKLSKDEDAAFLSLIFFSTSPFFVSEDAHFLSLRHLAIPLLAFSIFFLLVKQKNKLSGFLLALFSLSIIPNAFISLIFILSLLLADLSSVKQKLKKHWDFIKSWAVITLFGYLIVFLIPNSYQNLISFQNQRPLVPFLTRIELIKQNFIPLNWPLLFFGLLGSVLTLKKLKIFKIFNPLSFFSLLCLGSSFYLHYLSTLIFGFSVASGSFISLFRRLPILKTLIFIIMISLALSSLPYLKSKLIDETTPDFFRLATVLKTTPSPLFTYQPIYALAAQKELTYHYYMADMRYFYCLNHNLDEKSYLEIINKSKTVLLTPYDFLSLPDNALENLTHHFKLIYEQDGYKIFINKEEKEI